jgi:hypothetical protein
MRCKIPRYSRSKWVWFYCIVSMRASLGYPCVTTNEIAYYIWKKVSREEVELSLPLVRSKLSICISKSHWARKYQPCITRVLRIICGNNILASGRWIHGYLSPLLSYFSFTVVVSFICGGLESNREP